ncbi:hypothetical protein D3C84_792180 [compost metagenome]
MYTPYSPFAPFLPAVNCTSYPVARVTVAVFVLLSYLIFESVAFDKSVSWTSLCPVGSQYISGSFNTYVYRFSDSGSSSRPAYVSSEMNLLMYGS